MQLYFLGQVGCSFICLDRLLLVLFVTGTSFVCWAGAGFSVAVLFVAACSGRLAAALFAGAGNGRLVLALFTWTNGGSFVCWGRW